MVKAKEKDMFGVDLPPEVVQPVYVGWFQPHFVGSKMTEWTGEVVDPKTGQLVKEPSMTKQSFKDECDINNIIKAFQVTGIVQHINERASQGMYVDLPDPMDYQQSIEIARQAQASFDSLPSKVRNRFDNDPQKFLEFVAEPANQQEMIDLGLAQDNRPAPPPPDVKADPAKKE